jgi:hypothetical protein
MKTHPQFIRLKNRCKGRTVAGVMVASMSALFLSLLFLITGIPQAVGDPVYELTAGAQVDSSGVYFNHLKNSTQT